MSVIPWEKSESGDGKEIMNRFCGQKRNDANEKQNKKEALISMI